MKTIVFKLGGEALISEQALNHFLQQIKSIQQTHAVVIVHGGGPQVEQAMQQAQLTSTKVDGVRCTPKEHLPTVVGALAGVASQQLLSACKANNINAVALSLTDGASFTCSVKDPQLGAVGNVVAKDATTVNTLLKTGHVVLLSSIGADDNGNSLNINADDAAVAAAELVNGDLVLLSNVPGVLDHNKQLINKLTPASIEAYINEGVIIDGMVVKVKAALNASDCLRRHVTIASWQDFSGLQNIATEQQISMGTQISAQ